MQIPKSIILALCLVATLFMVMNTMISFQRGWTKGFIEGMQPWHEEREKLIDAGMGRYVADPKTGAVTFQYGAAKP